MVSNTYTFFNPQNIRMTKLPYRSLLLFALLSCSTSLRAQGLASIAVPRENINPEVAYHAKVREAVTLVLQNWAQALEAKDSVATARTYTANARSHIGELPESTSPLGVVRQLFATPLAGSHMAITIDDFDMSGELAFVTGTVVAYKGDDSAPAYVRSLFIFRFDDWRNRWQVREQFLNWRPGIENSETTR